MAKPRVHEIAAEFGVPSKQAMTALKAIGEHVKGPSSSIQPPVARKLRAALQRLEQNPIPGTSQESPLPIPRQPGEHHHAYAARVRREVVARSDADWARYGFTAGERTHWVAAGIPGDKAHLAAMCRHTVKRSEPAVSLASENLAVKLAGGTVLDALIEGASAVRTQRRLAKALGAHSTGVSPEIETLVSSSMRSGVAGSSSEPDRLLRTLAWSATNVPAIADAHFASLSNRLPLLISHRQLREQADAFRDSDEVGPVLAEYARIHGVFHPDRWLHALLDGIEGGPEPLRRAEVLAQSMSLAAKGRRFAFLASPPEKNHPLDVSSSVDEMIAPTGYALIAGDRESDTAEQVLMWVRTGNNVRSAVRSRTGMLPTLPIGPNSSQSVDSWQVGQTGQVPKSATLVRLISLLERQSLRSAHGPQSQATPPVTPVRRREPNMRDDVVIVYRSAAPAPGVVDSGRVVAVDRRQPDHRWMVRGHYRRQWYPREQTHKTIWIDSHESGPADQSLIVRERVTVVRPPAK